jgi:hypothetical protein
MTQTDQHAGWPVKLTKDECLRRFAEIHHPKDKPLGTGNPSLSTYRYPHHSEFEAKGKYAGCCTSCLKGLLSTAELNFQQSDTERKVGALNYEPNDFEVEFLHFNVKSCCGECAQCLDYLREVAYQDDGATGVWKQYHDEGVRDNVEIISRHMAARTQYFEQAEQREDESERELRTTQEQQREIDAHVRAEGVPLTCDSEYDDESDDSELDLAGI